MLLELGFAQSAADPAVFLYQNGANIVIIVVYVDDVRLFSPHLSEILALKVELAKRFKMTDQGPVGHFLGMRVQHESNGFTITQSAYIRSMLERFGLSDVSPVATPLDAKQRLAPFVGDASDEDKQYQAMVGSINWLAQVSRPDLAFTVAALSRYSYNPGPEHLGCAIRTMRYIAGTSDFGLHIQSSSPVDIETFSEADFAGDASAKSTSGWCINVFGATVAWGSKLQSLIADSTAQAEVMAVWQTARKTIAIRHFLEYIGVRDIGQSPPTPLHCDNQPAIQIISSPVSNGITRHMERRYLATREHVERGILDIRYITTSKNPADIFTKPLVPVTHNHHRAALGLRPSTALQQTSIKGGSVAVSS